MKYLLDTGALFALAILDHEFHDRMNGWLEKLRVRGIPELATCAITEMGFVRILAQAPQYSFTVEQGKSLLSELKKRNAASFTFIADGHSVSELPQWVRMPKQITDGHLAELAKANGAILATLDERIPGSFVIPGKR
jgi:predicted nucleic acid-binding protein